MAEVIEIGKEQALALLERAVQEKGEDYVYPPVAAGGSGANCTYERDGAPSCIVGHALAYVGVAPETLHELDIAPDFYSYEDEYDNDIGIGGSDIEELAGFSPALVDIAGVRLTNEAITLFQVAQRNQDQGTTWGVAVEHAKARLSPTNG